MHSLFHISTSISTEYFISVRAIASTDMKVRSADTSTDMEQAVHYYFYHIPTYTEDKVLTSQMFIPYHFTIWEAALPFDKARSTTTKWSNLNPLTFPNPFPICSLQCTSPNTFYPYA